MLTRRRQLSWTRPIRSSILSLVVASAIALVTGGSIASATTDDADALRSVVAEARAGSSCGPFREDPAADRVAAVINKSYADWLAHTSSLPPITDAFPGLKELGYLGTKGIYLGGVSKKLATDAYTGVLLEGYAAIPDCSYTDIGVNVLQDSASGYTMAAVVLGGP